MSLLNTIVLLPLMAALLLCLVPRNYRVIFQAVSFVVTLVTMILAIVMFCRFDSAVPGYQFEKQIDWVKSLGISFHLGVDGINVGLILMGAIVAFAASWVSGSIDRHVKEFYILLLVMTGGILGAFASLDLFFFYFFHELALVPTFIMIGVWGRGADKNYATFQITLYLSLGALISLIGLIALYLKVELPGGQHTFDIPKLIEWVKVHPLSLQDQSFIFTLLLFGFGILVSLWPFHTWAPLGYGSAPTATAMLHAGVLKKFGLYGLIRIALPMLPHAAADWAQFLAWLCLGNIFYCGLVTMRQRNFNWLIGYSSVAHMGFVFLGIASLNLIGVTGAVLVMVAHGFLAALSFALSGYLYHETGTLEMEQLGGLLRRLPFIGTVLIMAMFAGCGLPGFANFAGEVTVFFGAWSSFHTVVAIAAWGALITGAVYMLRAIRKMLHGPLPVKWMAVTESSWPLDKTPYLLLLTCLLLFGFFPGMLANKIKPAAERIVENVERPAHQAAATAAATIAEPKK